MFSSQFSGTPMDNPFYYAQNTGATTQSATPTVFEGFGAGTMSFPTQRRGYTAPPPRSVKRFVIEEDAPMVDASELPSRTKRQRFLSPPKTPTITPAAVFSSLRKPSTKATHRRARSEGGAQFRLLFQQNIRDLRAGSENCNEMMRQSISPELAYSVTATPTLAYTGSRKVEHRTAKRKAGFIHFHRLLQEVQHAEPEEDEFGKVLEEYRRGF